MSAMFKRSCIASLLGGICSLLVIQPIYASGQVIQSNHVIKAVKHGAILRASNVGRLHALNLKELNAMIRAANGGNSFQSKAASSRLPVSASIDPATLSLSFSEKVVDIHSAPLSSLHFALSITNQSTGIGNKLLANENLYLNIPSIRLLGMQSHKKYFKLYLNGDQKSFVATTSSEKYKGLGDSSTKLHFYYDKQHAFKLSFVNDDTVTYTDKDGVMYIFKRQTDGSSEYRCVEIVDAKGKHISFQYDYDQGTTKVLNDAGTVIATIRQSSGFVMIQYLDLTGTKRSFMIEETGNNISLVNPLNQTVSLEYSAQGSSAVIKQVNFPSGAYYKINYTPMKSVNYIINDLTTPVNYNGTYVSTLTKHFNNSHTPDEVIHYSLSKEGYNFAGNGANCSKSLFESVNAAQDWLMECSLNEDDDYGYSTTVSQGDLSTTYGYNYLHLPVEKTSKYNHQIVGQSFSTYDTSSSDKTFKGLSDYYSSPISKHLYLYNVYDLSQPYKEYDSYYQYYTTADSKDAGYLEGQLKSATDALGNQVSFKYAPVPDDKNYYAPMIQSETTALYAQTGDRIESVRNMEAKFNWLENDVSIDNKEYHVNAPYYTGNTSILVNKASMSTLLMNTDTDKTDLTYGRVNSSTQYLQNGNQYLQSTLSIAPSGTGYVISTNQKALINDANGQAPTEHQGVKKYFNQYGALVKTENPLTGDIVNYASYDALGRVTEIDYLPAGNAQYQQTYKFSYGIDSAKDEGGTTLSKTIITPTTGKAGYQIENFYNQEGKLVKSQRQRRDRKGWYVTQENAYNDYGKLSSHVAYYYDETETKIPHQTSYLYNKLNEVIGEKRFDGSAVISINDKYNHRKISYHLEPTGQVITNTDSLCRIVTDGGSTPSSCKVSAISVSAENYKQIPDQYNDGHSIWQYDEQYRYSVIMDPNFSYIDSKGDSVSLYDQSQKQTLITLNDSSLQQGNMYDVPALNRFLNSIQQSCLTGSCTAGSFVIAKLNALKKPIEIDNVVKGTVLKNVYDKVKPTQLNASTLYAEDNHTPKAIKTLYYDHDQYGHVSKVSLAKGAYSVDAKKTAVVVGRATYTALGYLIGFMSGINQANGVKVYYDEQTGLPILKVDAAGDKERITYDSVWKSKPSSIVYASKANQFSIHFGYDGNGQLKCLTKKDAAGNVLSELDYSYDPVTLKLLEVTSHHGSEQRSLQRDYNAENTVVSSSYLGNDNSATYQVDYKSNHLGLPIKFSYTGASDFDLEWLYNADLSLKESDYKGQITKGFDYDSLGRLTKLTNYKDGKEIRAYQYGYDRMGRKANFTVKTQKHSSTSQYGYTPFNQLSNYSCQGDCPLNILGDKINTASYHYNNLYNNLLSITQVNALGKQEQITYQYHNTDPTQVTGIDYGNNRISSFKYDENGNVLKLTKVTKSGTSIYGFDYDGQQNLIHLDVTNNNATKSESSEVAYSYGPTDKQIAESVTKNHKTTTVQSYYLSGLSEQRMADGDSRYYVKGGSIYKGSYQRALTDGQNVTGSIGDDKVQEDDVYMPFGAMTDLDQESQLALSLQSTTLAYRMMSQDQVTGWQFLGEGYRAYDPELRVFLKHDSYSPMGSGGVNGYNYASNDPINNFDPTGHTTEADNSKNLSYFQDLAQARNYRGISSWVVLGLDFIIGGIAGALTDGMGWGIFAKLVSISFVLATVNSVLVPIIYAGINGQRLDADINNQTVGNVMAGFGLNFAFGVVFELGGYAFARIMQSMPEVMGRAAGNLTLLGNSEAIAEDDAIESSVSRSVSQSKNTTFENSQEESLSNISLDSENANKQDNNLASNNLLKTKNVRKISNSTILSDDDRINDSDSDLSNTIESGNGLDHSSSPSQNPSYKNLENRSIKVNYLDDSDSSDEESIEEHWNVSDQKGFMNKLKGIFFNKGYTEI